MRSGLPRCWRSSQHLIDLDAWTYERRPGPASKAFPYDRIPLKLLRIEVWPKVGGQMLLWLQDPISVDVELWRVCSTINKVTRQGDAS